MSLILVTLTGVSVFYGTKMQKSVSLPTNTLSIKHISIRIPLHSWTFEPDHIDAKQGDRISITLVNADDISHGFVIPEYRVRQSIQAFATTTIPEFTVGREGKFQFYCSEICGAGTAESGTHLGEQRGHFDMAGLLEVTK